jgi:PAS domain-containing protein
MNADNLSCLGYIPVAFPQSMVEALERLQPEQLNGNKENIYIYDLVERQTLWASSSAATILGYSDDDIRVMGPVGLANLIHPDDVNYVSEHYQRFSSLRSGEVIVAEYRMKRADGTWCYLRSQETPLVVAMSGVPVQVLGILKDMAQSDRVSAQSRPMFNPFWYDVN